MKKTKIICTLGPASSERRIIAELAEAGMDVARLNFSHGTHEDHKKKIDTVRSVREELNIPLPILLDTKGPEFRIGKFKEGRVKIKEGDSFVFTTEDILGDEGSVSVSYKNLCNELSVSDTILLNNGLMIFKVEKIEPPKIICRALCDGELSDRKSMYFPDSTLNIPFLSDEDRKDLLFGIKEGVDFVALSFVSSREDVASVRCFLDENGGQNIDIIAKIESRRGVEALEEIMEVSDGIMIARGDLGVEVPYERLPDIQKHIIDRCRAYGKRVITATEMLESMIHSPRPTRAEISDVANAVYDGTSAVMLSGETASGENPVESVRAMSKILVKAEAQSEYIRVPGGFEIKSTTEALSHSASLLAKDLGACAIIACTNTGRTARLVSRFRPECSILGITRDETVYRKLALSWGVYPALTKRFESLDILFYFAKEKAVSCGLAGEGDTIVITGGTPGDASGNSSIISIEKI